MDCLYLWHELVGHGLPVLVGDGVCGQGGLQVAYILLAHYLWHELVDHGLPVLIDDLYVH